MSILRQGTPDGLNVSHRIASSPAQGQAFARVEAMSEQPGTTSDPDDRTEDTIGASSPGASGTTEKDPSDWVTGDEPMTGAQRSYLDTLAREAGEQLPADLTKAQASEHIDRLQAQTGRGSDSS
jgi:hypothetical protein